MRQSRSQCKRVACLQWLDRACKAADWQCLEEQHNGNDSARVWPPSRLQQAGVDGCVIWQAGQHVGQHLLCVTSPAPHQVFRHPLTRLDIKEVRCFADVLQPRLQQHCSRTQSATRRPGLCCRAIMQALQAYLQMSAKQTADGSQAGRRFQAPWCKAAASTRVQVRPPPQLLQQMALTPSNPVPG